MDLLDVLILAFRLALIALLYGFLIMVMRGAARGLRTAPRPAEPTASSVPTTAQLRLIVLEPGSAALRAGQVIDLPGGAILGRGGRATVVIADPAVSAEHARVSRVGRAWVIADLDSTNGTRVNETPVNGEMPLAANDVVALGSVRLKVVGR